MNTIGWALIGWGCGYMMTTSHWWRNTVDPWCDCLGRRMAKALIRTIYKEK